jgi:hypothetical protein
VSLGLASEVSVYRDQQPLDLRDIVKSDNSEMSIGPKPCSRLQRRQQKRVEIYQGAREGLQSGILPAIP